MCQGGGVASSAGHVTFVGHSTVLIELSGVRLLEIRLTPDPVPTVALLRPARGRVSDPRTAMPTNPSRSTRTA